MNKSEALWRAIVAELKGRHNITDVISVDYKSHIPTDKGQDSIELWESIICESQV